MDKRLCEKIIQNFTFPTMEVLNDYITHRFSVLHTKMETASLEDIRALQGQIQELKILSKIRDHAIAIKEV